MHFVAWQNILTQEDIFRLKFYLMTFIDFFFPMVQFNEKFYPVKFLNRDSHKMSSVQFNLYLSILYLIMNGI